MSVVRCGVRQGHRWFRSSYFVTLEVLVAEARRPLWHRSHGGDGHWNRTGQAPLNAFSHSIAAILFRTLVKLLGSGTVCGGSEVRKRTNPNSRMAKCGVERPSMR